MAEAERLWALTPQESRAYIDALIDIGKRAAGDVDLMLINTRAAIDTRFFAQTYMWESFDSPMTKQNIEAWQLIDDETIPRLCFCGWRGFGKTTNSVARLIKKTCFRQSQFAMKIGINYDAASTVTENIKAELLGNERIRYVFGSFKAKSYDGDNPTFGRKAFYLCDPLSGEPFQFIVPKGAKQTIRGANVRIKNRLVRPDDLDVDDIEDDREVLNGELRKELRDWFNSAVKYCINTKKMPNPMTNRWQPGDNPSWTPPWRIFYQDTIKHEDANIAHILGDPDWVSRVYPQSEFRVDADGEKRLYSLVPELLSDAVVQKEYESAKRNGHTDIHARELMCLPRSEDNSQWTRSMFKYYSEGNYRDNNRDKGLERFIVIDPAKSLKTEAAHTAMLAVGADCTNGKVYFRDLVNIKCTRGDMYERAFELMASTNSWTCAIEIIGSEDIEYTFQNEAAKRGLMNIRFIFLTRGDRPAPSPDYGTGRDAAKRALAKCILPWYQNGYVYHDDTLRESALERQELSFPTPTEWDCLDCAGYVPRILEELGRFFVAAPDASKKYANQHAIEEYKAFGKRIRDGKWRLNW